MATDEGTWMCIIHTHTHTHACIHKHEGEDHDIKKEDLWPQMRVHGCVSYPHTHANTSKRVKIKIIKKRIMIFTLSAAMASGSHFPVFSSKISKFFFLCQMSRNKVSICTC